MFEIRVLRRIFEHKGKEVAGAGDVARMGEKIF